jgi:hypothetical protein
LTKRIEIGFEIISLSAEKPHPISHSNLFWDFLKTTINDSHHPPVFIPGPSQKAANPSLNILGKE